MKESLEINWKNKQIAFVVLVSQNFLKVGLTLTKLQFKFKIQDKSKACRGGGAWSV
jgi:hypothetical protein